MSTPAELYASGMTVREVAERLGITQGKAQWAIKRAGVRLRGRQASRSIRVQRDAGMSVEEMAALYAEGKSLRQIAELVNVSPHSIGKYLEAAGVPRRTRGEGIRLAKSKPKRQRVLSRPPAYAQVRKYGGEVVEAPPPKSSEELCVEHGLSPAERMLVHCLVAELRNPSVEQRKRGDRGRPPVGAIERSPSEQILHDGGVAHPRRQARLMSCAIAAAKEAGALFSRPAERLLTESA